MKLLFTNNGSGSRTGSVRNWMAAGFFTTAGLLLSPSGTAQVWAQPSQMVGAQVAPDGVQNASVPGNPTGEWPARIATTVGTVTIYQPQLIKLDGDVLYTRAAVSILKTGETDPLFGAIWMESRLATDRTARTAQILDVNVTRSRFPDDNGLDERQMTVVLRSTLPQQPLVLSLDQLLAMVQAADTEKQTVRDISNDPPKIVFRNHPAVLVQYDGAPRLVQVEGTSLLRADNTPFFVVLDMPSKSYYLKGGGRWYVSRDPMGPYQDARVVPTAVTELADKSGYKDPQEPLPDAQATGLEVVTAMEPTELVWTDGPEEMGVIPNTDLLYLTNTQSDVFLNIETQQIYVLLSGRWYVAPNRNGPWTYVAADELPADFKLIPATGEKGDVLAHVAGTQAARDAVADTFVPQTAAIERKNYEQPVVEYDGAPVFQQIETTQVSYCVNTPQSVLFIHGRYYLCNNAVWYVSESPIARWDLCTFVPSEVYMIPSTCPVYSVRYVYVYDYTPDVIYVGYMPGYLGCYPHRGVVVYGTGYRYRPWIGHTYYARPSTFGFAARYNSYSGHWGFTIGYTAGSGYGWIGRNAVTTVSTTTWFGQGGYRPGIIHHDPAPRHTTNVNVNINIFRGDTRRPELNVYDRRHDVRRPPQMDHRDGPRPMPVSDRHDKRDDGWPAGRDGRDGRDSRDDNSRNNNVFADSKGNVYRKTMDGWERLEHNKWVPRDNSPGDAKDAPKPSGKGSDKGSGKDSNKDSNKEKDTNYGDLNRDYKARVDGNQRSKNETKPTPPPSLVNPRPTPPPSNDRDGKPDRQQPPRQNVNEEPSAPSTPQRGKDRDSRDDSPKSAPPAAPADPSPAAPQRNKDRDNRDNHDSRGGDSKQGKSPSNDTPSAAPSPSSPPAAAPPGTSTPRGNKPGGGKQGPNAPKAPSANPPQAPQQPSNDPSQGNDDNKKGDSNDRGERGDRSDRGDRSERNDREGRR